MVTVSLPGLLLLAVGVPGAIWPEKIARFGEQIDAIGSKRSSFAVEPADWNVALTRGVGVVLSIVGALAVLVNLLASL